MINRYITASVVAIAALGVVGVARADDGDDLRPAVRGRQVQVTPTVPPPSIRDMVNAFQYRHYDDEPAMTAYRLVAVERGWSSARIEAWAPFVRDVMLGESAFCWNRRRGDVVASYSACVITRQGTHEDVGFGQVTTSWYGQGAILCEEYGVCRSSQVLASPYASMLYSIVIPIEEAGSRSWCYSAAARSYHDCWKAPDR